MKNFKLAFLSLTVLISLSALYSCSSDRNPFDIMLPTERNTAAISLKFDVAATRADDDNLSTDAEKVVSKVSVYVFDESDKLQM
ncbi:MAG: hypothetical protein K2H22_07435, partial [Muribaculaceae bacterium]|nr:hypothetical protein [Muribaculaceae bacterium]